MRLSPDLAFCFRCSGAGAVHARHAMRTEITWSVVSCYTGASLLLYRHGCPYRFPLFLTPVLFGLSQAVLC